MNFQYAYCGRCRTAYAPDTVDSLCPQCNTPLCEIVGTVEGNVASFLSTLPSNTSSVQLLEGIALYIPGELKEAFVTFLEVGLASVTAHMEELKSDELELVELLQSTIDRLEHTEPTAEETLSRNRTLLRGDSADTEGL